MHYVFFRLIDKPFASLSIMLIVLIMPVDYAYHFLQFSLESAIGTMPSAKNALQNYTLYRNRNIVAFLYIGFNIYLIITK